MVKVGKWTNGNGSKAPNDYIIEVEIKHCNPKLGLQNEFVKGFFGDDGFYLTDGGELSYNWDIIRWRTVEKRKLVRCNYCRKETFNDYQGDCVICGFSRTNS